MSGPGGHTSAMHQCRACGCYYVTCTCTFVQICACGSSTLQGRTRARAMLDAVEHAREHLPTSRRDDTIVVDVPLAGRR